MLPHPCPPFDCPGLWFSVLPILCCVYDVLVWLLELNNSWTQNRILLSCVQASCFYECGLIYIVTGEPSPYVLLSLSKHTAQGLLHSPPDLSLLLLIPHLWELHSSSSSCSLSSSCLLFLVTQRKQTNTTLSHS